MARVVRERTETHGLVAGSGPMRAELEALAESLGAGGHIHFIGHIDQQELSRLTVRCITLSPLTGMALLLHELGKGFEEDHSEVGRRIAAESAQRLGLPHQQAATLEFLVHRQVPELVLEHDLDLVRIHVAEELGHPDAGVVGPERDQEVVLAREAVLGDLRQHPPHHVAQRLLDDSGIVDPVRVQASSVLPSMARMPGVCQGRSTVPAGVQGPQRAIRQTVFKLPWTVPYLRIAISP